MQNIEVLNLASDPRSASIPFSIRRIARFSGNKQNAFDFIVKYFNKKDLGLEDLDFLKNKCEVNGGLHMSEIAIYVMRNAHSSCLKKCFEKNDELKSRSDVALAAMRDNIANFRFVDDHLKVDRKFMIAAIQLNAIIFNYSCDALRNDKEFMLAAMKCRTNFIFQAGDSLRNDKEFMLDVMKCNTNFLTLAGDSLRNDKEFMLDAIKLDGAAYLFACEELRRDRIFNVDALTANADCRFYIIY